MSDIGLIVLQKHHPTNQLGAQVQGRLSPNDMEQMLALGIVIAKRLIDQAAEKIGEKPMKLNKWLGAINKAAFRIEKTGAEKPKSNIIVPGPGDFRGGTLGKN